MAKLLFEAGVVAVTSVISPFRADREAVRSLFPEQACIEVFVACQLEVCESRDPKGLYRKVRNNEIKEFTGISSPYEEPEAPEVVVRIDQLSEDEAVDQIFSYLMEHGLI